MPMPGAHGGPVQFGSIIHSAKLGSIFKWTMLGIGLYNY
jgi:hypothetical protein